MNFNFLPGGREGESEKLKMGGSMMQGQVFLKVGGGRAGTIPI